MRWFLILLTTATLARADGEVAGDFDYYVLSLSWSPDWCVLEGDAKGSPQCDDDKDFGWVLHGLWPQYDRGYPSYCRTIKRDPPRSLTNAMADIMGTSGLAWYQWKKHGRCAGLSAEAYFNTARRAFEAVTRPPVFRKIDHQLKLRPTVIEEAFLDSNPNWGADMVTITCKSGYIQEARICLTKDLTPRDCGADVVRDCTLPYALIEGIR